MKNRAHFNRVLVTKGDQTFPAGGLDLYTIKVSKGRKTRRVYNNAIKVGQPIAWKVSTTVGAVPVTVDPTTLVVGDLSTLRVGVAHSSQKNGIVDSIRAIAPNELGACNIEDLGAYGPSCGLSHIEAIYPKCLDCSGLTLLVRLEDNETKSFHPLRKREEITINYTPNCKECDSCDREITCDEYMCGLVDAFNGKLESAMIDGLPYPGIEARDIPKPIRAVKLHENFFSYCFGPTGGTCTECDRIEALTTFTVNGTEYTFEGVTDPADSTKTLVSQLKEVNYQIECAFEEEYGVNQHGGFAVLTQSLGSCCGIQLYVSTCDVGFEIAGITPCPNAIVPFPTFEYQPICKDCSSTTTNYTPKCGMAIITDGYELECDCYPLLDVPAFPIRTVDIRVLDHEYEISDNFETATLQKPTMPGNYGAQVQVREYNQKVGGEGFDFAQGNNYSGRRGLPDKNSQLNNMVTADCHKSYCTYIMRTTIYPNLDVRPRTPRNYKIFGEINVPQGDTTTKTAIEAFFAKLAELNPQVCKDITAPVCEPPVVVVP